MANKTNIDLKYLQLCSTYLSLHKYTEYLAQV